jgi:hypothetical protein
MNNNNDDCGKAARALWEQRAHVERDRVYAALMGAWDWEHNALCEAFGTIDDLASALRAVAPPLKLEQPLKVWRGIMVHDNPAEAAIGLSWSTSFPVACWFATERAGFARMMEQRGAHPFVFALTATADEIIALHGGGTVTTATEREALLEPAKLDKLTHKIVIEGTTITLADLQSDSRAPAEAVARWRAASARYETARRKAIAF